MAVIKLNGAVTANENTLNIHERVFNWLEKGTSRQKYKQTNEKGRKKEKSAQNEIFCKRLSRGFCAPFLPFVLFYFYYRRNACVTIRHSSSIVRFDYETNNLFYFKNDIPYFVWVKIVKLSSHFMFFFIIKSVS